MLSIQHTEVRKRDGNGGERTIISEPAVRRTKTRRPIWSSDLCDPLASLLLLVGAIQSGRTKVEVGRQELGRQDSPRVHQRQTSTKPHWAQVQSQIIIIRSLKLSLLHSSVPMIVRSSEPPLRHALSTLFPHISISMFQWFRYYYPIVADRYQ